MNSRLNSIFENPTLIYVGAEAEIYKAKWYGLDVVIKRRIPKPYRIRELDLEIRARRTLREAKILHHAKKSGVPAPTVYFLNLSNYIIVMSYIEGMRARDVLNRLEPDERAEMCRLVGVYAARLHEGGIQHGDLTTSNIMLTSGGRICLVDFGLSFFTKSLEDMAVDVLLFKRALISTHYKIFGESFKAFLEGYSSVRGENRLREVLAKVREIESRGRYVVRG